MPFTNRDFPGRTFKTISELKEAQRKRKEIEASLAERSEEITRVTATIVPAPKELLERKVASLQRQVSDLSNEVKGLVASKAGSPAEERINGEGVRVGTILQSESRGRRFTLEVLDEGYLCSDGAIYQSLSGAALGVSGNRRSGWKFWKDIEGNPIGNITGRFRSGSIGSGNNPFRAKAMP